MRMHNQEVKIGASSAGLVPVSWEYPRSSGRFYIGIAECDTLATDRTLPERVTD